MTNAKRPITPGEIFGKLTVIGMAPTDGDGQRVTCLCECGKQKVMRLGNLVSGTSRSCGCGQGKKARNPKALKYQPEYGCWSGMLNRCRYPRNASWKYYGARGITVCERWKDFAAFLQDVGRRPSPKHSLDRINSNGNYEPGNVRWATQSEQNRNRRPFRRAGRFSRGAARG